MLHPKLRRITGLFFLLLFIFYTSGNSLFLHTHIVDGTPVTHSHPWKTGHQHSTAGLLTISLLNQFSSTGDATCFYDLTPVVTPVTDLSRPVSDTFHKQSTHCNHLLRAPPYYMYDI